jgi:two-component system chemotaxis response regulator CheY
MALNILIVDDSSTSRKIIRKTLELTRLPLGEIWEAGNGLEGLEQMHKNWVDLVLADLNMPGMSGQEMIDQMGKDPLLAKLQVIVISSEGSQSVLDSLFKQGVREVVRKPFEQNLLREVIERTLEMTAEQEA